MQRHLMEQHCACSRRLWIIEYAWAHNMLDVFKDVEASFWSEGDWKSLSLDESWRVRIASAQVFSIVRNRQISHYESVLAFLESTHSLLPTLVSAIKHMKITFGLKTMVIMWMLREGAGAVDVVQKINKYFPRKLTQYQEHCRKHEMFLMRQNQLDFRTFAQSLIMDKQKLEDYIQNRVEEQYGDRYAQKTEQRLLDYLQELDRALPKGTYIDKIMRKNSPVKEEKALLDLITDDSKTIATALKTLLRCDSTFCYLLHKSKLRTRTSKCIVPESDVCIGVPTDQAAADKSAETVRHIDSPVTDTLMNNVGGVGKEQAVTALTDRSKKTAHVGAEKTDSMTIEESCLKSSAHWVKVPPHFCSKHRRWVTNILCECPGESSEEPLPQDSEISPPLFTSSSSDLTPSNLTIPPVHHQSPSPSSQEDPEFVNKPVSKPEDLGPPSLPTAVQTCIPGGAVKVVFVPCKTVTTDCPLKSSTSNDLSKGSNQDSTSSTLSITAKNVMHQTATSPTPFISKLSRRFRLGQNYSQSQKNYNNEDGSKNVEYSPPTGFEIRHAVSLSAHATSGMEYNTLTRVHLQARSSPADHVGGSQVGSSAFSSSRMQPRVVLKRMSREECLKAIKGRLHPKQCDDVEGRSVSSVSLFDVNSLYSSSSSSSSEEEEGSDTEYRPDRKTLKRWFLDVF